MLQKPRTTSLSRSGQLLAPFIRVFANTLGNGRWFDTCVSNLVVPAVTPGLPCPARLPDAAPARHSEPGLAARLVAAARGRGRRSLAGCRIVLLAAARPSTVTVTRRLRPRGRPLPGLRRAHPRRHRSARSSGHPRGRPGAGRPGATTRSTACPADAKAAVVAPSLVSDRYVQLLAGVHRRADAARTAPRSRWSRTAVPVELDRDLPEPGRAHRSRSGPNGANKNGALSDLLAAGADNLDGNGEQAQRHGRRPVQAAATLADGRDDLFGTVKNLQAFTSDAGRQRPPGAPAQHRPGQRRRPARGRARRPRRRAAEPRRRRSARWRPSSGTTGHLTTDVTRLADGHQRRGQAEGRARRDPARTRRSRCPTWSTPTTPTSGTLDTRDNVPGAEDPSASCSARLVGHGTSRGAAASLLRPVQTRSSCPAVRARRHRRSATCRSACSGPGVPGRRSRWHTVIAPAAQVALARPSVAAARRPHRLPGRVRPAAARRRGHGRPRVPGDRRVRRRAGPGAAVGGQGRRRDRRQGRADRASTAGPPGSRCGSRTRCSCRPTPTAELRQTSLLGEKYVELAAADGTSPRRASWATARSSRSPAARGTRRSRRCSARCRCCSTAAASPSSRSSRPS